MPEMDLGEITAPLIVFAASSVLQDIMELINKIILAASIALVTFACAHLTGAFIRKVYQEAAQAL